MWYPPFDLVSCGKIDQEWVVAARTPIKHRQAAGGSAMLKWWRRIFQLSTVKPVESKENLPFTAEEMARLIRSGRRDDFRRLAAGLSDPRRARRMAS